MRIKLPLEQLCLHEWVDWTAERPGPTLTTTTPTTPATTTTTTSLTDQEQHIRSTSTWVLGTHDSHGSHVDGVCTEAVQTLEFQRILCILTNKLYIFNIYKLHHAK